MKRIEDMSANELQRLLSQEGENLTAEQIFALYHFLQRIGGIENARLAVQTLRELEDAA